MGALVGLLAAAALQTATPPAGEPEAASKDGPVFVCDVVTHPQDFDGKTVTINGRMDLKRPVPLLSDESCDRGLPFKLSKAAMATAEWRWIEQQRYGRKDLLRLTINGIRTEVTGKVSFGSDPELAVFSLEPFAYLTIESFNGVSVPPVGSEPND